MNNMLSPLLCALLNICSYIGGLPYSFNADIWALGLSLLTFALGEFPYNTSGGYWGLLNEIKSKYPKGLKDSGFSEALTDFLQSCLERDPDVVSVYIFCVSDVHMSGHVQSKIIARFFLFGFYNIYFSLIKHISYH